MSALTKILIVLQLVFSLILSVVLVLMVSKQENYKNQVDGANSSRLAAVAQTVKLQEQLSAANALATSSGSDSAAMATALQAERTRSAADAAKAEADRLDKDAKIAQLTNQAAVAASENKTLVDAIAEKDKRLNEALPQLAKLNQQNNDLYRANQEAQNQLRAAEQAVRKLQEAAVAQNSSTSASPAGSDGQVTSLSSANQSHAPINARIGNIAQANGRTVVELPLGTRDGVQVNTKLFIYRSTGYVGEAVVTNATADQAVATVTATKQGETVRSGDMVSTDK